jgi:hypothetical protein
MNLNSDAIRTAEQIRAQISKRPATILVGGQGNTNISSSVALDIAKALSILGGESTLLVDLDHSQKLAQRIQPEVETPLAQLQSGGNAPTQLLPNLAFCHAVSREGQATESLTENLQSLKAIKSGFDLTVAHTSSMSSNESYALLTQVDYLLVTLEKGVSKLDEVTKLNEYCKVTPATTFLTTCMTVNQTNGIQNLVATIVFAI